MHIEATRMRNHDEDVDAEYCVGWAEAKTAEFTLTIERLDPDQALYVKLETWGDGLTVLGEFTRRGGLTVMESGYASLRDFERDLAKCVNKVETREQLPL